MKSRRSKKRSRKSSKRSIKSRKLSTRWSHRPSQFQKKQSGTKYEKRSSPPYKANEYCGQIMKGNDGQDYISKKGSNGVCRWVRTSSLRDSHSGSTQRYLTLNNGGHPFEVLIDGHNVSVYNYTETENKDDRKKIWSGKGLNIFVGENQPKNEYVWGSDFNDWQKGTSILVQIKPERYVFIGDDIFQFSVEKGDEIVKYYTPTGNSSVPYPFAIGKYNTYLMLHGYTKNSDDMTVLPHTIYDPIKTDPYSFFWYGDISKRQQKNWKYTVKTKPI